MFLLIGKWGKLSSEKAAYSYLIYNGIGSAILLIVFSILFMKTGTTNIVELKEILRSVNAEGALVIPSSLQLSVFIAIMIAFAIKLPVFSVAPLDGQCTHRSTSSCSYASCGCFAEDWSVRYYSLRERAIPGIFSRCCNTNCDIRRN